MLLTLYRAISVLLGPFASAWLAHRARTGKEDPARLSERFGYARAARPEGALVWLHAASVGEMGVARQIIDALSAREDIAFLVTTGTRTSAELFARRPPPRARHAYAPLDRPDATRRFIAHWRPDLGVFIESDLWPNLIDAAARANVRLALVNARMSAGTLARWRTWSGAGRRLLGAFSLIAAADQRTAAALSHILGRTIAVRGNLKLAAPAPHPDARELARLRAEIGARPVWLAASTHEGEDEIVLAAHARLREAFADALLIIAPRHPERGERVAQLSGAAPRRACGDAVGAAPVYVADTMGELALFYALAPAAFIAGSLSAQLRGHNPIEAALCGCAVVSGPHVESFSDLFAALDEAGACVRAPDAPAIAAAIADFWREPARAARCAAAARSVIAQGAQALDATCAELAALLPGAPVLEAHARA